MRLNGWQRIGIVLSIAWLPVGAFIGLNAISKREQAAIDARIKGPYDLCRSVEDQSISHGVPFNRNCLQELYGKNLPEAIAEISGRESRWSAALIALAPIPFAWLVVYLLVLLGRWIWRGFIPKPN